MGSRSLADWENREERGEKIGGGTKNRRGRIQQVRRGEEIEKDWQIGEEEFSRLGGGEEIEKSRLGRKSLAG